MSHKKRYDQTLLLLWVLLGTIHKVRQFENDIFTFYSTCHSLLFLDPKSSLLSRQTIDRLRQFFCTFGCLSKPFYVKQSSKGKKSQPLLLPTLLPTR